ncbi:MAG: hypothetical protein GEU28_10935 [Dehalococcoidia bacterium]|nr:hypothetical protein [Dehalococcoidia bacterium]
MLLPPISQEDYEELAEALDAGTANELLKRGWSLVGIVAGGPVTYVFARPRMMDIQEVIHNTEALLDESTPAEEPVVDLQASRRGD